MIVVSRQTLPFLLQGRIVEATTKGAATYLEGRVYGVWLSSDNDEGRRKLAFRVKVMAVGDDRKVAILLATDEIPRFLAANFGRGDYTHEPARAAKGEPEALQPGELEQMAKPLRERDDAMRRERAFGERFGREKKRAA